VIGSQLRHDHPLLALRLRARRPHGAADQPAARRRRRLGHADRSALTAAPSRWLAQLAEVAAAVAAAKGAAAPLAVRGRRAGQGRRRQPGQWHEKAVLLGNWPPPQHPQAATCWRWRSGSPSRPAPAWATRTGANAAGAAGRRRASGRGRSVPRAVLAEPPKALLLLGVDPLLDVADPAAARASLTQAELVVGLASHRSDALLELRRRAAADRHRSPKPPGSFINTEGRVQSFKSASCQPLGDARPGWKVLRVLANCWSCRASSSTAVSRCAPSCCPMA
jgi:NADH-quinone oxidoreductase subunit G